MIQLLFTDQAEKQLSKLDKSARLRIIASLDRLRDAYPVGDLRKMQAMMTCGGCASVIIGLSCTLIWSLHSSLLPSSALVTAERSTDNGFQGDSIRITRLRKHKYRSYTFYKISNTHLPSLHEPAISNFRTLGLGVDANGTLSHVLPCNNRPFCFFTRLLPSTPHPPHCLKKKAERCSSD
jgi:hypothetical protein